MWSNSHPKVEMRKDILENEKFLLLRVLVPPTFLMPSFWEVGCFSGWNSPWNFGNATLRFGSGRVFGFLGSIRFPLVARESNIESIGRAPHPQVQLVTPSWHLVSCKIVTHHHWGAWWHSPRFSQKKRRNEGRKEKGSLDTKVQKKEEPPKEDDKTNDSHRTQNKE